MSVEQQIAEAPVPVLFELARIAHEHAMRNMRIAADRLAVALDRAEKAREHAERSGQLLTLAVRMRELEDSNARREVRW